MNLNNMLSRFYFTKMLSTRFWVSLAVALFSVVGQPTSNAQAPNLMDYAKGSEYEIENIRVEGAKYLDGKILITLSGLAVGDKIKIPGDQIPKAIKTLWKQRLFTNISIDADRIEGDKRCV